MTLNSPAGATAATTGSVSQVLIAAEPSRPWRRAVVPLALAGQLITISALVGTYPPPQTWPSLLLAVAPIPLAVLTALTPRKVARVAALAGAIALVTGMAGAATHTGLFFLPALVAFAGATAALWRER